MDRRTLMAFILLALILVLFARVTSPPQQPSTQGQTPPRVDSVVTGGEPGIGGASIGESTGAASQGAAEPSAAPSRPSNSTWRGTQFRNILPHTEEVLTVQTRLYRAGLSARGGRIQSWKLATYTDSKEEPADLVAQPEVGLLGLALELPDGRVDLSETEFCASSEEVGGERRITLEARDSTNAKIRIEYTFRPDKYSMGLKVFVDGISSERGEGSLALSFPGGIAFPERDRKVDHNGAAGLALLGKRLVKHNFGRLGGGWDERESGVVHWVGTRSKYFLLAALPKGSPDGQVRLSRVGGQEGVASTVLIPLDRTGSTEQEFTVYAGPLEYRVLESYDAGLERAVELGWTAFLWLTRPFLKFFQAIYRFVPNYGLVILILSILTKVLFYPLTKKSTESMRQMQLLKPEMDRLSAKFKEDPQRRNQAMMDLYKKHKINPMGGCLPLLIQMPVFIALYSVLNSSIELRKAPFALWIQDLSAPDKIASIAGLPIHVLPLVMAATMIWQQKLTPTDPRQAAMAYLMPIVMTVIFYPMPSGLVFYWTVNNLMQIGQQIWMNRSTNLAQVAQTG